ncbi:MAG TPA: hypothetical protein VFU61_05875 [Steroidobacteraceae bacterium]|nr:hypothetical protein [Steroidobacteraceae bacterium]
MRIHGPVLLAAALLGCSGFASEPAIAGTASSAYAAWSDLWRTPDQQGEELLDAGQPAQAAGRFHDPRRRAYADLRAGRYAQAAKLLAPFTDAQSEYNRGNALARSGQLQAALAAYDAALKQAPGDKDIRHNRDLVERELRQHHQSPESSSHDGRQGAGAQGQPPRQSAGQGNGSGSQQPGSGSQRSGGTSQQPGGRQPSADGTQTASNGPQSAANSPGSTGRQDSGEGAHPQSSGTPQAGGASGAGAPKDSPGQAQRDAEMAAALARQQARRGGSQGQTRGSSPGASSAATRKDGDRAPGSDSLVAGGSQTPKQKPESEKQLALDQWLRQIPDSPAGLLQRKFLIEHMMKQQDGENAQESGQ